MAQLVNQKIKGIICNVEFLDCEYLKNIFHIGFHFKGIRRVDKPNIVGKDDQNLFYSKRKLKPQMIESEDREGKNKNNINS